MDDKPKRAENAAWGGTATRRPRTGAETREPASLGRTIEPLLAPRTPRGKPAAAQPAAPKPKTPPQPSSGQPPRRPAMPPATSIPPAGPVPAPRTAIPRRAAPTSLSPEHGRAIAETMVGSFLDRMKSEAQRKGGTLTLTDIEALNHEFEQKTAALEALLEQSFQEYLRAHAAGKRPERRHSPFDRLIVTPIEDLFPRRGPIPTKPVLSRRILPGFFMAVNMMMGADGVEECRRRAKDIFERVNVGTAGDAGWKPFLADAEAQQLLADSLVGMAVHFANPDKRAAWFMDVVNNHLSPPQAEPGIPVDWKLGQPAYERMIDALFADLMTTVGNAKAREILTRRFGAETCASIVAIMKGLGA